MIDELCPDCGHRASLHSQWPDDVGGTDHRCPDCEPCKTGALLWALSRYDDTLTQDDIDGRLSARAQGAFEQWLARDVADDAAVQAIRLLRPDDLPDGDHDELVAAYRQRLQVMSADDLAELDALADDARGEPLGDLALKALAEIRTLRRELHAVIEWAVDRGYGRDDDAPSDG